MKKNVHRQSQASPAVSHSRNGYTLIETISAMVITILLSSMIFALYLRIFDNFHFYSRQSAAVMESVVCKKKIDCIFDTIESLGSVSATRLEFSDKNGTQYRILEFKANALYLDKALYISGIKTFTCTVSGNASPTAQRLLLWEATLENSDAWISGAVIVDHR